MFGGGNPVGGSNPAGTGSVLNYVGEHAYAYSGAITCDNNETTLIDAATGNNYIVAKFQPSVIADTSDNMQFNLKIDGQLITRIQITSSTATTPYEEVEIIIAPNTRLEVTCLNQSDTSANDCAAMLTGRVY
tara:strand:- start:250 stop:645 length:396 start_codon:yes stop_codon:yes gene_type:complete